MVLRLNYNISCNFTKGKRGTLSNNIKKLNYFSGPTIYSPRITKAELFLALPSNLIDFYNIEIFLHILMYARNFDFRKSDVIKNYVGCRLYHKLTY